MPFELVITELSKVSDPVEKICSSSAYWIPLQWLYERMVENKDLAPLAELPIEDKKRYWNMVKHLDKDRFVKL